MPRALSNTEQLLGPRPHLRLVIEEQFVREIWVDGRAPIITIHDYDWGVTDPDPAFDEEGFAFSPINWRRPAWMLGLSLHPPVKETYTMANQKLRTIPLTDLKVSKLNMRHGRKKPDISDLLPSIRKHGLRQSLLVREEGNEFGVVAGRRRLFALNQIAKETGVAMKIPCIVMQAGDDAAAIEASIIENAARLPASEMQQYVAFNRLSEKGRTPSEIAEYFGITELSVRRVLALANLSSPIRALYENEEIDRQTIYALTLATLDQQTEWLTMFNAEDQRAPRGRNCKAWVTGGASITSDKALFDPDQYEGEIISDLFGEHGVFANVDEFWDAQSIAIAARVGEYKKAGWCDVQILDRGHYFQSWDHEKRARTKGGKVFVELRHDGTVTFHVGFVTNAEARKLDKQCGAGDDDASANVRPEMTKAMGEYLFEHRRLAAGASLLGHPKIALRLMLAHVLVGSSLWTARGHSFRSSKEEILDSLTASRGAAEIEQAEAAIAEMFKANGIASLRHNGDAYHLCEVFTVLLGMDDDEVLRVLTVSMVSKLEAASPVVEAVAVATETDIAAYWKPDEIFFDLLRDKRAINAMIADIASRKIAEPHLAETAKSQKEVLANRISGEGCEPNPDWRPGWMQVPPTAFVEGAPSFPADQWQRINALFDAVAYNSISDEEENNPQSIAA